jgi:DNA-3-methyladenine glycosylase
VPRSFYNRDARDVAVDLLNKLLDHDGVRGRIVETEAYLGELDPGSHAFRGLTNRNRVMFGPPGFLYVYFTYGMHWCCNAVCGPEGTASAVLLRALAPLAGTDRMRERRAGRGRPVRDRDLTRGPARLCQALGITGAQNGVDLARGDVRILDDGTPPPDKPGVSARIGLRAGAGDEHEWRYFVAGDPNVSGRVINRD